MSDYMKNAIIEAVSALENETLLQTIYTITMNLVIADQK